VTAAQARRINRAAEKAVRIEWYLREVVGKVKMTMQQRVSLATEYVKTKTIKNISIPVVKGIRARDGKGRFRKAGVLERSKPGEFPRADTTRLMKDVFKEVQNDRRGNPVGYVGTTLDYGAILETSKRLNRSFLLRTFKEESRTIRRIMTGPMQ
jgi:hypothetical protein